MAKINYLQNLIGKKIENTYCGAGKFYAIGTGEKQTVNELILYIEEFRLTITNRIEYDPQLISINDLIGCFIDIIIETKENIKIITKENKWILIDLRDEAFAGPEALVLNGPENLIVVWN